MFAPGVIAREDILQLDVLQRCVIGAVLMQPEIHLALHLFHAFLARLVDFVYGFHAARVSLGFEAFVLIAVDVALQCFQLLREGFFFLIIIVFRTTAVGCYSREILPQLLAQMIHVDDLLAEAFGALLLPVELFLAV